MSLAQPHLLLTHRDVGPRAEIETRCCHDEVRRGPGCPNGPRHLHQDDGGEESRTATSPTTPQPYTSQSHHRRHSGKRALSFAGQIDISATLEDTRLVTDVPHQTPQTLRFDGCAPRTERPRGTTGPTAQTQTTLAALTSMAKGF